MAGEWLKMECATPDKPEVLAIAAKMGWDDPDLAVGKLFRLWRWFDQQTTDGNAHSVTAALLDRQVGVSGFIQAVADVGWLSITADGISLANFERHNGKTAKERALTAKRVANHKANGDGNAVGNATTNGAANAATVSDALPRKEEEKSISPSLRSGESAGKPRAARRKKAETTLQAYIDACKAAGQKPLPVDHPIRSWCADAGITEEMLQVAWCVFRDDHLTGKNKDKQQKDWPAHFANSVRRRWYELWYTGDNGVAWTSNGLQERKVLEERHRQKEGAA